MMKLTIQTKDGDFTAYYSKRGLARLDFPEGLEASAEAATIDAAIPEPVAGWHQKTIRALTHALAGRIPSELPPLDMTARTGFQQRVWAQLLRVQTGQTRSYTEIAELIGKPNAARGWGRMRRKSDSSTRALPSHPRCKSAYRRVFWRLGMEAEASRVRIGGLLIFLH